MPKEAVNCRLFYKRITHVKEGEEREEGAKKKSEHTISAAAAVVGFLSISFGPKRKGREKSREKKRAAEKVACIADDRRRYIYT
jgi:hypothetical protein